MSHTPEPWSVPQPIVDGAGLPFAPVFATTLIAKVYSTAFGDTEQATANARRIVACVNACAGIETYVLELMADGMSMHRQTMCQHNRYSIDVHEQTGRCIDCGAEGRMRFVVGDSFASDLQKTSHAQLYCNYLEAKQEISQIKQQRDKLLAVCEELSACAAYWSEYDVPIGIVARLDAAIAEAKGAV